MSCGLHDVLAFEELGRRAVLVASTAFAQAASGQAERLGASALARVLVPHPVQDRTDGELRAMAHEAVDALLAALMAPP